MSKESKPRKPRSSTKKSTSELEAKIAELEAKLGQLSSQVKPAEQHARPAEKHSAPPPAPKPRPTASGPTHGTLPAGMAPPPKPKEVPAPSASTSSASSGEVAPAYATISSTGYTGNKYFATRARLSYHPPDKQFKGESVTQTSTSRPSTASEPQYTYQESSSSQKSKPSSSTWKAKGAQAAEEYKTQTTHHDEPGEETRHAPPPAPKPRPTASGPTHGTLPAGMAPPPKPKEVPAPSASTSSASSGEVAPAYATISSTGYTGNKYFATRARLSYHPPDKQFKGESAAAQIVQVAPEKPKPKRGTLPAGWKP